MSSSNQLQVASNILLDHFGELVEKVVLCLLSKGSQSLRELIHSTELRPNEVRKALLVAIQHRLAIADFRGSDHKQVTCYTAQLGPIVVRQRLSRLVRVVTQVSNNAPIGQLLIEELLLHGQLPTSRLIELTAHRMVEHKLADTQEDADGRAREEFIDLVRQRFLQNAAGNAKEAEPVLPKLGQKRAHSPDRSAPSSKRPVGSSAIHTTEQSQQAEQDDEVFWQINFQHFHQCLRNEAIVEAVMHKFDAAAGSIVKTMLRLVELQPEKGSTTSSVTNFELFHALPGTPLLSRQELNLYLKLLTDGANAFLIKLGEQAGGTYGVHVGHCLEYISHEAVTSVVQEKFGSKCLRIFRILMDKKHLEEKQIGEFAMIPVREAREHLYKMLQAHFITFLEVPKAADHNPTRTFFLFSVNMEHVTSTCIQHSYKAIANLQSKRRLIEVENRRLLERWQQYELHRAKLQAAGSAATEEDWAMLEEDITPAEKALVEKAQAAMAKLEEGELLVDKCLLKLRHFALESV